MEKLNILWTTTNKDTVKNMLAMYAMGSKKKEWWDEVNIIIWGGSADLLGKDPEIQEVVREMINQGIKVQACQACAEKHEAVKTMENLGIEVKHMGEDLTAYIKKGEKMLTL